MLIIVKSMKNASVHGKALLDEVEMIASKEYINKAL